MFHEQLSQLRLARFEIVLEAQTEAILPALIGSTLRGAFGHALKAISCSVQHQDCEKCFLAEACLYTTVFEPTSQNLKDVPRPFVFQPPVPPLTREISEEKILKMRISKGGKVSFGLVLIGEAAKKLPYFVYAFEMMARHGLGADRQSFAVSEVFSLDANDCKTSIYTPDLLKILPFHQTTATELIEQKLSQTHISQNLKIRFQTPLRIRRNRKLLEKITFGEIFKQCSLRLKFLTENYGTALEYDYQSLMKTAETVEIVSDKLWKHAFSRHSNRQNKNFDLDGMLGEIELQSDDFSKFLPFLFAGEFLNIGSASSLGLGKFKLSETS